MNCPHCNAEHPAEARACPACGRALRPERSSPGARRRRWVVAAVGGLLVLIGALVGVGVAGYYAGWFGRRTPRAVPAAQPPAQPPPVVAAPQPLVFVSGRAGDGLLDIFLAPAGLPPVNLTQSPELELDPVLSPDGRRIAFAVADPEGRRADLYVMNVDGTNRRALTRSEAGTVAFAPSWSPDGRQLAYAVTRASGAEREQVAVVDLEGGTERLLGPGAFPAWSPDGAKILYAQLPADGGTAGSRLAVMNADGTGAQPVGPEHALMGSWSPDGRRIAYVGAGPDGAMELLVMDADGANSRPLTQGGEFEIGPRWSPDGAQIFFTRVPSSEVDALAAAEVWVVNADGQSPRALTTNRTLDMLSGGSMLLLPRLMAREWPPQARASWSPEVIAGHLKELGAALDAYARANGDRVPPMETPEAMQATLRPYVKDPAVFVNPRTGKPYQPNRSLSGKRYDELDLPAPELVALYEDSPAPNGSRAILYLDGHVDRVRESLWNEIKADSGIR